MRNNQNKLAFAIIISAPFASAQTVDEVFEGMIDAENAGYRSVENFLLKTETLGMSTVEYYEKTSSVELDNGQTVYIMRNVPPGEIQERQSANALSNATPEQLEHAAMEIEQAGIQMEQGMRHEMDKAGLSGGLGNMLMTQRPDEPWLSANPRDMTSMYATMLNASADEKKQAAA